MEVGVREERSSGYRLPSTTSPLRYDIELTTHIHDHESENQFKFEGKVSITLCVLALDVQDITLHYRQIVTTHVKLSKITATGNVILVDDDSSFSTDETYEFLIVHAPSVLEVGIHVLEVEYRGELRTDNAGFYRSSYTDTSGQTRWIATTQLQSTDARHAFPCYDEPGIRAPIGLKVTHGDGYQVIANMPVKRQLALNQNHTITEFEDTPRMQTYLLAFVVSDFDYVPDIRNNQKVYAKPESIQNGDLNFALEVGAKVMHNLQDYLQVNYNLPKLDQIGIPDFAAGAMENWGLVAHREEAIIYNSTRSPMEQMKRTVACIAHEYAHQFFGDLISPEWWSYLWLNEGFATLLQYIAGNEAYPEMRIKEMFTVEVVQAAFQSDALETTHLMNSNAETPSSIMALFDDVSYDKAGSVLRQLQHAIGDEVFRTGLKYYLNAKQFQSATPNDLAAALQRSVDENDALPSYIKVADIINSWANQAGFPLLHVSRDTDNVIKLRQERYLLKPSVEAVKATWYIPYNLATFQATDLSSTLPYDWLTVERVELHSSPFLSWESDDWVIVNKQQTGFYRVNYDDELWELLISELQDGDHKSIHHLNRAQLIDDSLNLARSGHLKYDIALRLAQYVKVEKEYVPWASLNNGLVYLNRMLVGSTQYPLFQQYVWDLVKPSFRKFGMENKPNDTLHTKLTRNILINWACLVGSKECLTQINAQLAEVVLNNTEIDPNLKSVVYSNGLRNADHDTFQFVLNRMHRSPDPSHRVMLIGALGCSQDSELLQLYLETSLNETRDVSYRDQERLRVFSAVYTNGKVGLEVAMRFLKTNADAIDRLYSAGIFGGRAIGSIVTEMAKHIVNKEQYDEFAAMNVNLTTAGYLNEEELAIADERACENVHWTDTNYVIIEHWLDQNVISGAKWFKIIGLITVTMMLLLSLTLLVD